VPPSIAALGLRAHSGWAALVAITGRVDSPSVIDRRIIQLCNPKTRGSKQPYHAAEPLPFQQAEKLIARCIAETQQLARDQLQCAVQDLAERGFRIVGCGILLGSGRALPSLDRILASHALIHTAEGEMFREALMQAAQQCNLTITAVKERELYSRATADLKRPVDQLRAALAEMGHSLGPPWREDQKLATLAAWIGLVSPGKAATARALSSS
jgi:hypothetical protein